MTIQEIIDLSFKSRVTSLIETSPFELGLIKISYHPFRCRNFETDVEFIRPIGQAIIFERLD